MENTLKATVMLAAGLLLGAGPGSTDLKLNGSGYSLPATLERPAETGPCVVFLAGSGPTDRNWCSPLLPGTNGSAAQLALALRKKGVGSIRFDKVGSAANIKTLGVLSLDHYVDEALLAYKRLAYDDACTTVYLLGHSEGSLHAARAASKAQGMRKFGGLIHLAGPSYSLADTMVQQLAPQAVASGLEPQEAVALMTRFREAVGGLPESAANPPDLTAFQPAAALFRNLALQATTPQLRGAASATEKPFPVALMLEDPLKAIRVFGGPLLVVSAVNDLQVTEQDAERIFAASPSTQKHLVRIKNANHVFKQEVRPPAGAKPIELVKAYAEPGRPLASGLVDAIIGFMAEVGAKTEQPTASPGP